MTWLYNLIGKMFFRRQQDWERQKNAKIMTWVFLFSLTLAAAMAAIIYFMSVRIK